MTQFSSIQVLTAKVVFLGLMGLASAHSNAAAQPSNIKKISWADGREEAAKICQAMHFTPDQDQCFQVVRNAHYFNLGALDFCPNFTFEDEKINCLSTIADKNYEHFELTYCASKTFKDEQLECLKTSGQAYNNNPPNLPSAVELRDTVRSALIDMRYGNTQRADATLVDLLHRLGEP